MNRKREIEWRWGVIAAFALTVLALYPQLHFSILSGNYGTETYAHMEGVGDEVAYSAYVNALIDGRPRRNDPYTGRDDASNQRQPESLFSIQFVPAYMIALPARALGLSASSAFIWLMVITACVSALAVFWLVASVTRQDQLAAVGAIFVLCLGTLVSGHGQVVALFGLKPLYNYLVFLRRYQPAATFPFFFIFCALVWRTHKRTSNGAALVSALAAGAIFALLVFSYFYLWTAAAAWLSCLALLWLWARPDGWQRDLKYFSLIGAIAATALVPYLVLLSQRAATMDTVEAYVVARAPDFFRLPELIAVAVLLALVLMARRGVIDLRDKAVLFAASFALMPLAVFNQQILTGRTMQPVHYEMFVANYSALLAIVLSAAIIRRGSESFAGLFSKRALVWIALAAFEWGAYEAFVAASGSMEFNRRLAAAGPVAQRLSEIARAEEPSHSRPAVLATDLLIADGLPTHAPQPILYAPHMLVYSGASEAEGKERFYQYLYYTGIDEQGLKKILKEDGRYGFVSALFGFERAVEGLSDNPKPISGEELDQEVRRYAEYRASFTRERAASLKLSYLVLENDAKVDLSNLDQWYERDGGEVFGSFTLYRLKLRDESESHMARALVGNRARGAFLSWVKV
jgi:hypothetical protein